MNVRYMIDLFRGRTQDTKRPYLWPDDELFPLFSEAEKEAAIRALLIRDEEELSVSAGDNSPIALPDGLFDIQYAKLVAADGTEYELTGATRRELDRLFPGWRATTDQPAHYVHDDKTLILSCLPDANYTLLIEFYRLPASPLGDDESEPEIAESHHEALVDWVMYRAYQKPDVDTFNAGKSAEALASFTAYFGKRPSAQQRRSQNACRPHRNKVH